MCWRISSRSDKFITLGHALSCCLPIFVGWYYMYTCVRVSEQLNDELKQNLKKTMTDEYNQTNSEHITKAVDKLQQEVSVCNGWRSPDTNVVQLCEISLHIWISTLASVDGISVVACIHFFILQMNLDFQAKVTWTHMWFVDWTALMLPYHLTRLEILEMGASQSKSNSVHDFI